VSVACEALLLLLPLNLCFGTALLGSPLAEDKSFIMVDLALLLHLHIIFIGTFFYSRPEYKPSHYYRFIFQVC